MIPSRSSFRDPSGALFRSPDRVLRWIAPEGLEDFQRYDSHEGLTKARGSGSLIAHSPWMGEVPPGAPSGGRWVEHPRISFPSYPEEWSLGMLKAAGVLTLDLALEALEAGLELKDATPRNVLFKGPAPCFVDALSFRTWDGRPVWDAYQQFVRCFLLPLFLGRDRGLLPARAFTVREGVSLEEAHALLGPLRRLFPPYLSWVTLPLWLSNRVASDQRPLHLPPETSRLINVRRLKALRRTLNEFDRPELMSRWTDYTQSRTYDQASLLSKQALVDKALDALPMGSRVLDLGANTGEFSRRAAKAGHSVVAIDSDEPSVERIWTEATRDQLDILPLVMNLANPSPGTGWGNEEQSSFLERAASGFDGVLVLALIHHLRITEGVPLHLQMSMFAQLTRQSMVIEWVGPEDSMVQSLVSRFRYLPTDYTQDNFEAQLLAKFVLREKVPLGNGNRCLYWVSPRG